MSVSTTKREDDPSCKTRQSRRKLDFNQAEKIPNTADLLGEKCNNREQTTSLLLEKEDTTSIKRWLVQVTMQLMCVKTHILNFFFVYVSNENDELKKKVGRLENEKEEERKFLMYISRNLKNKSIH